jgi:type IV pilus assembly protein PilA
MIKRNQKGFTLIELMIVIAIIGILAAIAIPNFISYRNKSYCSRAESDANSIVSAISDYFSIPNHTGLTTIAAAGPAAAPLNVKLSGNNTGTIGGTITAIQVSVVDGSNNCPNNYMTSQARNAATRVDGWDSATRTHWKYMVGN